MKYLLIISLLLLVSCKKERTFPITAKNAVTGEPYPGLSYNIERSWSGSFENKYKTVGSGELDENGEVYFSKRLPKNSSYSISVGSPENTCYFNSGSLSPGGEKNFKAEFEFAECAYLKFRYQNINYQGPNDHMKVKRYTNLDGYSGFLIDAEYDGCNDYTMPNFTEVPMGQWIFEWEVTKNNVTTNFSDTIFLNANEQKYYEFNY